MASSWQALMRTRSFPSSAASLLPAVRQWLSKAGALLPGSCALCGATGTHAMCRGCQEKFFLAARLRCRCCALPLAKAAQAHPVCGKCLQHPPVFDATVAATDYVAPVDQLVLGLKFGARLALAPLFAQLLRDAMLGSTPSDTAAAMPLPEVLTAVPLGAVRLRQRGYNQALEIARPLSTLLGVPLAVPLLIRVRDTAAQAQLSPLERRHNLRGAFTLSPQAIAVVRGRHVGVVDDVITTGETLNEVAATLKRFGAARVTNLVFARTLPK